MAHLMLLIWGGFKMKSKQTHVKKLSAFKRALLTLIVLSLMGWFILLGLALFIWISHDFESAYQCIQHLSASQLALELPMSANYDVIDSTQFLLNDVQHNAHLFWMLIRAISDVMLMKFMMLITAIPLFFLSTMAGIIDGLNQRAIRAACLGRESTYVFHKSVPIAEKCICFVLAIWLCVPVNLPSSPIFVGLAVMLGLVMRVSASRFKKYL